VFSQRTPAIVLFAYENERLAGPANFKNLLRRVTKKEFNGADKHLLLLHTTAQHVLLLGLGTRKEFNLETLRRATGRAVKKLRDAGLERAAVQIRDNDPGFAAAIVEAATLATYKFTQFKSEPNDKTELKSLT